MQTSGQTKREIAADLGVGLSTLTHWLSRGRDREMDEPDRRPSNEDATAELKRLRRENEILRQERDVCASGKGGASNERRTAGMANRFRLIS
jgi:transposase